MAYALKLPPCEQKTPRNQSSQILRSSLDQRTSSIPGYLQLRPSYGLTARPLETLSPSFTTFTSIWSPLSNQQFCHSFPIQSMLSYRTTKRSQISFYGYTIIQTSNRRLKTSSMPSAKLSQWPQFSNLFSSGLIACSSQGLCRFPTYDSAALVKNTRSAVPDYSQNYQRSYGRQRTNNWCPYVCTGSLRLLEIWPVLQVRFPRPPGKELSLATCKHSWFWRTGHNCRSKRRLLWYRE